MSISCDLHLEKKLSELSACECVCEIRSVLSLHHHVTRFIVTSQFYLRPFAANCQCYLMHNQTYEQSSVNEESVLGHILLNYVKK